MNDPYLVLGVTPDADDESIRRAWLDAVRRFPPERHPERFEAARAAYERIDTRRHRIAHELFDASAPDLETLIGLALHARASADTAGKASDGLTGGAADERDGSRATPERTGPDGRPSIDLARRLLRDSLAVSASRDTLDPP